MRWILKLLGGLVVLAVLIVGVISLVPAEKIVAIATKEISARTGRDVAFEGKITPIFFPFLGVKTESFSIGNAEWAENVPLLRADSLRVGVEFIPLLSGEVRIKDFRLDGAELHLQKSATGLANWELETDGSTESTSEPDRAAPTELPAFTLRNGRIRGGAVSYRDDQSGQTTKLTILDLNLSVPGRGDASLRLTASYQDQVVNAEFSLASLADLLSGKLSDLVASADGNFGKVKFDGQIGLGPNVAEGQVTASLKDFNAIAALTGQTGGMDLPFRTASLEAKTTFAEDGTVYLRQAAVELDQNKITGDIDIAFEDKPKITAKLAAGDLDFSPMLAASGSGHSAGGSGWSDTRLDMSGLHAVDADIGLATGQLDLGSFKLDRVRARLTLTSGRLVVGLTDVAAYQGRVTGEYVINARGGLSMGGNISAQQVQLEPLLTDLTEYDRLIAAAGFQVKFLASGSSMLALMQNLSGSGGFDIGQGEIIGLDIAGMLRNLDASYRGEGNKTIFSKIDGSFQIEKGVLDNQDLVFEGGVVSATGKGQVDIGRRNVDYLLTPVAFSGGGGGISVPVLAYGPWDNIGFRPDLQNLVDGEIDKKRDELEKNIKADVERTQKEIEARMKEEADKAVQKALEDAARRALGLD